MVATAAHLTDHALPDLPLRQWVLAVPKRLRYFLEGEADLQGAALRLFLCAAVAALAPVAVPTRPVPPPDPSTAEPASRRSARYAWALLLAGIYEVFPLVCPLCGAEMRIIAFITDASSIRDILVHLGEPIAPPRVASARGPPLWNLPAAGADGGDHHAQPTREYGFDQRVAWQPRPSTAVRVRRRIGACLPPPARAPNFLTLAQRPPLRLPAPR
jgi:hypothetical protein